MPDPRTFGPALLLIAVGLAVFGNSLHGAFVYDDASIVVDADIRELRPPWRVVDASPDSAAAGRPVVHYSLALNYALGGLDVRGYHRVNVLLHLLCSLALYGVVGRTLRLPTVEPRIRESARGLALAAALIWTVHPLNTEVVDYVSQRTESLMALFLLLTLYGSIRGRASAPRLWYAGAIACCALGMASKETMVVAPLVVALHDYAFGERPLRFPRERVVLYAGLASTWVLLYGLMSAGPRSASVGFDLGVDALTYLKNQCLILVDYLKLTFWPEPLLLDYGIPVPLQLGEVVGHGVLLFGLLALTLGALVVRPQLGFLGAWFFLILAPTSSVVPIVTEVGAERRMYLPLAALVLGIVLGGFRVLRVERRRWLGWVLLGGVVVPLAWVSHRRNLDYRNPEKLWRQVTLARPSNARGHGNLGKALTEAGRPGDAVEPLRRALELQPDYAEAHNNLGAALRMSGEPEEAMHHFREALRLRPGYPSARYNLATVLQSLGRLDAAVDQYRKTLQATPDNPSVHNNLGTALGSLGDFDAAIRHFRRALELAPGSVEYRRNLDLALERQRAHAP